MNDSDTEPEALEVWYDGDCHLCQGSRRACELRDSQKNLVFKDFRVTDEANLPAARHLHEATLWAKTSDGRLLSGFDAWRRIMAALPAWRWLAWLTGVPPIPVFGRPLYDLIARFRLRLAG